MRVPPHATINRPAHLCHLRRRGRLILMMTQCHILRSPRLVAASDLSSSSLQLDLWHRPPVGQCHVHLVARSHIQPVAQCHLRLGTMPPPIRGAVPNSTSDIADLWCNATLNLWRNRQRSTWLATFNLWCNAHLQFLAYRPSLVLLAMPSTCAIDLAQCHFQPVAQCWRNAIFDLGLPTLALLLPAVKVLALLLLPLLLAALVVLALLLLAVVNPTFNFCRNAILNSWLAPLACPHRHSSCRHSWC
jgi:hypothetical protein